MGSPRGLPGIVFCGARTFLCRLPDGSDYPTCPLLLSIVHIVAFIKIDEIR